MANTLGLNWELVSPFGIELDEVASVWYCGHVTDGVEVDDGGTGHLAVHSIGVLVCVPNSQVV